MCSYEPAEVGHESIDARHRAPVPEMKKKDCQGFLPTEIEHS